MDRESLWPLVATEVPQFQMINVPNRRVLQAISDPTLLNS
jgi:hypothetical protein